jgi:hypothetical protein
MGRPGEMASKGFALTIASMAVVYGVVFEIGL